MNSEHLTATEVDILLKIGPMSREERLWFSHIDLYFILNPFLYPDDLEGIEGVDLDEMRDTLGNVESLKKIGQQSVTMLCWMLRYNFNYLPEPVIERLSKNLTDVERKIALKRTFLAFEVEKKKNRPYSAEFAKESYGEAMREVMSKHKNWLCQKFRIWFHEENHRRTSGDMAGRFRKWLDNGCVLTKKSFLNSICQFFRDNF